MSLHRRLEVGCLGSEAVCGGGFARRVEAAAEGDSEGSRRPEAAAEATVLAC